MQITDSMLRTFGITGAEETNVPLGLVNSAGCVKG
jgi:hypothetical protein